MSTAFPHLAINDFEVTSHDGKIYKDFNDWKVTLPRTSERAIQISRFLKEGLNVVAWYNQENDTAVISVYDDDGGSIACNNKPLGTLTIHCEYQIPDNITYHFHSTYPIGILFKDPNDSYLDVGGCYWIFNKLFPICKVQKPTFKGYDKDGNTYVSK